MRVLRIETELGGKALHEALDSCDAVMVRDGACTSMEELALAEHLAESAFAAKTNIARSLRYEFLLWISGRRDIRSAMEATAPGEGARDFFVISFSSAGEREILRALGAEKKALGLGEKAEPLALERISLSRVKN
jgi:tRNA threonylcarbamoyladenosine modification (KEOPS) complex Cgi121 subunit